MLYKHSDVNNSFLDRQIWQLSYKGVFALVVLSCMLIEQPTKSKIVTCFKYRLSFQLNSAEIAMND
jgi:hypothetical protein